MKTITDKRFALPILHTLIVYLWTILGTVLLGTLAILVSFFSKTGDAVHHVARLWALTILWVSGIRFVIKGMTENAGSGSYIFMSNHQSNFDIPVLLGGLPYQFRWLAKAELFKIPIFGASMKGAGYISIDRSDRKSAFESLARAAQLIRNGTSVLIFPEGTRSPDGRLLSFKKGGFVLAVDAGVPIIPIIITGTHDIMPKKSLMIERHPVVVKILAPIETAAYSRENKDDLMTHVRQVMLAAAAGDAQGVEDA